MEYAEEELKDLLQKESDKRVTEALATAKKRWQTEQETLIEQVKEKLKLEIAENAKLSAEELAKKEFEEKYNSLVEKEKDYNKKTNLLLAKSKFTEIGIPKDQYEKVINVLVSDNEDTTNSNLENFISMYTDTKKELETNIKAELSKIPAPPVGGSGGGKKKLSELSVDERLELKEKDPDAFKKLVQESKSDFSF